MKMHMMWFQNICVSLSGISRQQIFSFLDEPNSTDPNYSSIHPFHAQPHSHRAHSQSAPKRNFFSTAHNTHTNNGTSSSQFTNSLNSSSGSTTSPSSRLKKSISGSQQNVQGHSSANQNGAHITPSPSDSGIILDYEVDPSIHMQRNNLAF